MISNNDVKPIFSTDSVFCGLCNQYVTAVSCNSGIVSPANLGSDYQYESCFESCDPGDPTSGDPTDTSGDPSSSGDMSCSFLGTFLNDGESMTVYADEHPCGACDAGTVTCSAGSPSGNTSFQYSSCTAASCAGSGNYLILHILIRIRWRSTFFWLQRTKGNINHNNNTKIPSLMLWVKVTKYTTLSLLNSCKLTLDLLHITKQQTKYSHYKNNTSLIYSQGCANWY